MAAHARLKNAKFTEDEKYHNLILRFKYISKSKGTEFILPNVFILIKPVYPFVYLFIMYIDRFHT